ncbi:MAG TPA: hypothetical protein VHX52_08310 [Steroidobacteraceae bacterium]|jgi:hypothetical protein|nr:hypothetical protein [Steroidobacteraceae bacterium]
MHASRQFRAFQCRFGRTVTVLLLLGLSGCISTALIERWKDPGFSGPPLQKVLVVGVQRDAGRRRVWESSMVDALMRQHIAATPSYMLFPDKAPSAEQLAAAANRQGFDGVLASHFVGASRRTYWVPGDIGFGWRWRYYGYWNAVYAPGFVQSDYRADYQTDVFTVAPNGGKLVWTGITRSVDLSSTTATTDQISRVLVPDLVREGILRPS